MQLMLYYIIINFVDRDIDINNNNYCSLPTSTRFTLIDNVLQSQINTSPSCFIIVENNRYAICWGGTMEWNGRVDCWSGLLDWTTGVSHP